MASLVVTDAAVLKDLTVAQINELAQHSLTWENRNVDSLVPQGRRPAYTWNNGGHSTYKDSGYPASVNGQDFSSRRQYLVYRLTERIKRMGAVYNEEGAEEAKAAKERLKKEREEAKAAEAARQAALPKFEFSIDVKAAVTERTPFYSQPHKINLWESEGGRITLQRAKDSKGREVCDEKVYVKKDALVAGIKALKDAKEILKSIPSIDLSDVKGVTFAAPTLAAITVEGDNPDRPGRSHNSNLKFSWDQANEGQIIMAVQSWQFRFHIDDFNAVVNAIGTEWVAVPKSPTTVDPTAVAAIG